VINATSIQAFPITRLDGCVIDVHRAKLKRVLDKTRRGVDLGLDAARVTFLQPAYAEEVDLDELRDEEQCRWSPRPNQNPRRSGA